MQFRQSFLKKIGRAAREAVVAMRPAVNKAVDRAIEKNKDDFIPTDDEAHELGIGSGGTLDKKKISGAYKGMLTTANNGVTSTETNTRPGTGLGRIGNIRAKVNFQVLFATDLARVLLTNTREAGAEEEVSWMQWLLEGETIQGWHFEPGIVRDYSRTGKGIMNLGGLWQFSPARPGFEARLDESMLKEISETAEKAIQDSIDSVR